MTDMISTFKQLLARQNIVYISSVDSDGFPCTKAMLTPRECLGMESIYFSTNTSSMRVTHYKNNPKACLYFCDPVTFQGLMLKGLMKVLEDQPTKTRLWRQGDEQYYPLGVTDPDYCALEFSTSECRYYNGKKAQTFLLPNSPD